MSALATFLFDSPATFRDEGKGTHQSGSVRAFQCFRSGTHTAADGTTITCSDSDLQQIARDYNPAASPAPLYIGHPSDTGQASVLGIVLGLTVVTEKLFALAVMAPELIAAVRAQEIRHVSASLRLVRTSDRSAPVRYRLDHIAFLTSQAPAVKGMAPLSFAAPDPIAGSGSDRDRLFTAALDLQAVSGLPFIHAAILAEQALSGTSQ